MDPTCLCLWLNKLWAVGSWQSRACFFYLQGFHLCHILIDKSNVSSHAGIQLFELWLGLGELIWRGRTQPQLSVWWLSVCSSDGEIPCPCKRPCLPWRKHASLTAHLHTRIPGKALCPAAKACSTSCFWRRWWEQGGSGQRALLPCCDLWRDGGGTSCSSNCYLRYWPLAMELPAFLV